MPDERRFTFQRLTDVFERATELPLAVAKYAVVSDIHLGDGGQADDFRDNEETFTAALNYYNSNDYSLILLGDIEELWQFDLKKVVERYKSSVYGATKAFGKGRVIRVFGNHDIEWGSPPDPAMPGQRKSRGAPEGLRLVSETGDPQIFLAHGHQGTPESDKNSWFSRFAVRAGWTPVERTLRSVELYRNPSEPKSRVTKSFEAIRYAWAKENRVLLVCGHSHRAIFASRSHADELEDEIDKIQDQIQAASEPLDVATLRTKLRRLRKRLEKERKRGRDIDPVEDDPMPCYFNTGCGVFSGGITAVEIEQDSIRLVKWQRDSAEDPPREELKAGSIRSFLERLR